MLNKKLIAFALCASSFLSFAPTTEAAPIALRTDFYGVNDQGNREWFGRLQVDVKSATQWSGNIYRAETPASFTIFNHNVQIFDFLAEFDLSDLYSGFRFVQFDVQDSVNPDLNFFGVFDIDPMIGSFYSFTNAGNDYYSQGIQTNSQVIPVNSTAYLWVAGLLALGIRRKTLQHR